MRPRVCRSEGVRGRNSHKADAERPWLGQPLTIPLPFDAPCYCPACSLELSRSRLEKHAVALAVQGTVEGGLVENRSPFWEVSVEVGTEGNAQLELEMQVDAAVS